MDVRTAAVCFAAALYIYAIRSFSCLFALWRTPTRHRSTSLELQLPIPGPCCRCPRLFCCQTNVRRKFSQNECLWSLQTSFSRMFGEICFCLLLDTSATATNLLNWTGEASGCLFLKRVTSFNTWLQRLARKLKNLVFWERNSWFFCNAAKSKVSQEQLIPFDHFTQPFEALNGGFLEKRCPVAMATIGKTLRSFSSSFTRLCSVRPSHNCFS